MSLHLKLLDIDHPFTFEESKLRQIEAHALIYLSTDNSAKSLTSLWQVQGMFAAVIELSVKKSTIVRQLQS